MTIDRWVTDAARRSPEKIALRFGAQQTLSYAAFEKKIDVAVNVFAQLGVKHGDRVAWYGLNHPDVFVLLFACARVGAIFVPLNWRLAKPEVAAIVANCNPRLLIHDEHFIERATALPHVQLLPNKALYRQHNEALNQSRLQNTDHGKDTDSLLLVYTSGSTGVPKGALLSQQAVACNALMSVEAHGLTESDTALVVLPLFHVGGLNVLPTPAFSVGATVILHERFDPVLACEDLQTATVAIVVPTVLQAMMACERWLQLDLSLLRGLSIGSTDVPITLVESIHKMGIPVAQVYGATETGPYAIYQTFDNAVASLGSIGRAGSHCDIRLVDNGVDVGLNEPGEIWVKGDNVLTEYWKNPELSAEVLQQGWLRTGDVASCDEQGFYWFKDRIKHVIISGGENIYPTEIERLLQLIDGVCEVSVVGKPDPTWGEIPVAVVVTNTALQKSEVLAPLQGQLASYKHPKDVVFVDELPRNAMGKVVAARVRAMIQ